MRFLSLFSGIEAASCAWLPLGWECVGVSEIEPFPCSLLRHHYPDVPNLGDITKITRKAIKALGKIDLVVGGFPCQDVSIAGKKQGLEYADGTPTRSGLFFDAMRIVEWIKPRWTVVENVPNLLGNNRGRDFAAVVGTLAGTGINVPQGGWRNTGVVAGKHGLVEWTVLDAQWRGLAQRRKRVFLVRDSGDWQGRPPVLIEPESLCGNPPSRGEAREDVAGTISARTQGGGGLGTDFELGGMGRIDYESETFIATGRGYWNESDKAMTLGTQARAIYESTCVVAGTLGANHGNIKAEHAWTNQIVPIAFSAKDCGSDAGELSPTLRSMNHGASHANGGGQVAISGEKYGVRRLTPLECERLQGFPDSYTLIPHRGKPAADGPRYKALGNSFAVPVVSWIGEQIMSAEHNP